MPAPHDVRVAGREQAAFDEVLRDGFVLGRIDGQVDVPAAHPFKNLRVAVDDGKAQSRCLLAQLRDHGRDEREVRVVVCNDSHGRLDRCGIESLFGVENGIERCDQRFEFGGQSQHARGRHHAARRADEKVVLEPLPGARKEPRSVRRADPELVRSTGHHRIAEKFEKKFNEPNFVRFGEVAGILRFVQAHLSTFSAEAVDQPMGSTGGGS